MEELNFEQSINLSTNEIEEVSQEELNIEEFNVEDDEVLQEQEEKAVAKSQSAERKAIFWRNVGFIAHCAFELHKLFPSDTFAKHKTKINYLYRGVPKELKPVDWAWKYAESQYKTMLKF